MINIVDELINGKKNNFICYRPYHIYISLIISYHSNNDNSLILAYDHEEQFKHKFELSRDKIISNIKWIQNVFLIPESRIKKLFYKGNSRLIKAFKIFNFVHFYKKYFPEIEEIMEELEGNIYMFHDNPFTSRYLMKEFSNLILLEDGAGNYQKRPWTIKRGLFRLLGWRKCFGRNDNIKKIIVQKPNELPKDIREKSEKINFNSYLKSIPYNQKEAIFGVFLDQNIINTFNNVSQNKKNILIITQPFSEIGIMSEYQKIKLYKSILRKHLNSNNFFLKPHPQEKTKYEHYFTENNVHILDKYFPLEILDMKFSYEIFEKAISFSSSALNNIKLTKEKKLLCNNPNISKGFSRLNNCSKNIAKESIIAELINQIDNEI